MGDEKIIFLGVGGDSYIVGKQVLSSGGIIICLEDDQFHVDPGPGSLVKAKQYDVNIRENTAVFVSHAHINHASDTNAVISAMTHSGADKKGVLVTNKTALKGEGDLSSVITSFHKDCVEKVIIAEPGTKLGINSTDIVATPTKHSDPNAVGYKFFTPKFVLSIVSDTEYSKEVADSHHGSDIIILNVVNPSGVSKKNQMNTDDAVKFLKRAQPSLAVITHFGVKMLAADPINEARTIQKDSKVQVIAAKDGMVINPQSYSATIRQKTLNLY
ncbi:hypothetical protein GOV05_05355 [Candidatus Woesearchaeota archaeon]|nr:hypothetical protein [Candidatus Woesearchaeota archaeon]